MYWTGLCLVLWHGYISNDVLFVGWTVFSRIVHVLLYRLLFFNSHLFIVLSIYDVILPLSLYIYISICHSHSTFLSWCLYSFFSFLYALSSIHFALMVISSKNFRCPPLSYWGRVFTLVCFSISRAHMNICKFRQQMAFHIPSHRAPFHF